MITRSITTKRIGASIAAAAVLAFPVAAATGTFLPTAVAQTGADINLPDESLTSTLTIHKLGGSETDQQATGGTMTGVPGTPLAGVHYEIQRLDYDLTTPEGWNDARAADAATITSEDYATDTGVAGAESIEAETDSDGEISISGLPVGLYLITETKTPEGVIASPPFLAFLPMTNENGDGWNTDVHVYPKNSQISTVKAVDDTDVQTGDELIYSITGTVPANLTLNADNQVPAGAKFEFIDFLDAENAYVGAEQEITVTATSTDEAVTDTVLTAEDYTVTGNDANAGTASTGYQTVTVALNDSGMAKIVGHDNVVMTMNAVVKSVGDTDGITTNFVRQVTNEGRVADDTVTSSWDADPVNAEGSTIDPATAPDTDVAPAEVVSTYHGTVTVTKVDAADNATTLAGAQFDLFASDTDLDAENITLTDLENGVTEGTVRNVAVGVDDITTWETGEDGSFTIDGLHASDFDDNSTDDTPVYYYLVETQAPDGYALLEESAVYEFTLDQATATDGVAISYSTEIENHTDENNLPLTGGEGMTYAGLAAGGLLVVGGSAYYITRNRRTNA